MEGEKKLPWNVCERRPAAAVQVEAKTFDIIRQRARENF